MNTTTTTGTSPDDLRARLVDDLVANGQVDPRIEAAMRTVPRHLFLPEATIEDAYADRAVNTKLDSSGRPLSCASQPTVVAMMLDQLDAHPGHRILEIGAGTGYNAGLLAELVGDTGEVTTVDIHPDVAADARRALDATGYARVHVITGDGALGNPDHAPYDRIIVTVGPWDLPPAWTDQLAPGGRLVVPLHWRGQARSIAFNNEGDHLRSDSIRLCGFIPMLGQDAERTAPLDRDSQVTLHWDSDQAHDPDALRGILSQPKTSTWSGITIDVTESFDGLWLRLTGTEPGTGRITATPAAVQAGLCTPAIPARSPAVVEDSSLAYLALRRPTGDTTAERRRELGAIGHGPLGPQLADRFAEQIRAWDRDRTVQPVITVHAAATSDDGLPDGLVITRRHTHLVISY